MLSYSVRFGVDEVILFHPNTFSQNQEKETELIIKDSLAKGKEILIRAFQLPIINRKLLVSELTMKTDLSELFEPTKQKLKTKIQEILISQIDI